MQGLIDLPRARILSDLTMPLPRELAREVTETALERAPGLTTGQLRAHLQRLIISRSTRLLLRNGMSRS